MSWAPPQAGNKYLLEEQAPRRGADVRQKRHWHNQADQPPRERQSIGRGWGPAQALEIHGTNLSTPRPTTNLVFQKLQALMELACLVSLAAQQTQEEPSVSSSPCFLESAPRGLTSSTVAPNTAAQLEPNLPQRQQHPILSRFPDHPTRTKHTHSQAQLCFVARLEPTRVRWNGDQVHTTRLETGKQVCKSATVSTLCTMQHSPSAWAGFAPKLTVTFTVAETKSYFRPHTGPSSCAH